MIASAPVTVTTTAGGQLVPRPAQRRAAQLDQHQRPARQGAADQGQRRRHVRDPAREPVPGGDAQDAAGDLRDGLPEPVPDPGRLRRRRLRDRLLARLAGAHQPARPGRHRPRGDRPQAVQLRLADVLRAGPAHVPVGLQHLAPRSASRSSATTSRPARRTRRAGTPACGTGRRSPSRTSGTRTTTTRPRRRARRASRTTTGPAAPARSSSRSSGPAASARTARPSTSSTRPTRARPSSRRTSTGR